MPASTEQKVGHSLEEEKEAGGRNWSHAGQSLLETSTVLATLERVMGAAQAMERNKSQFTSPGSS